VTGEAAATEPVDSGPAASRVRVAAGGAAAAVLGAAPHVLHHVGPLAGAAVFAGVGGTLLFGAVGFVLVIPTLRRIRGRTGSWAAPGAALALMATIFTLSALLVAPMLRDEGEAGEGNSPADRTPAPGDHERHHP
jgi:hypothetical protein